MGGSDYSSFTGKGERLKQIERRSDKDRRKNSGDRRDALRFESDDRRSGEDRRKEANRWSSVRDKDRRKR